MRVSVGKMVAVGGMVVVGGMSVAVGVGVELGAEAVAVLAISATTVWKTEVCKAGISTGVAAGVAGELDAQAVRMISNAITCVYLIWIIVMSFLFVGCIGLL